MQPMKLGYSRPRKSVLRDYGEALLCAGVIAMIIRTFVVQAFVIPSESMLNTLLVGDHLLASKFSYGVKIPFLNSYVWRGDDPERGDIIIFEYPKDPSLDYIKRVIGVPGDKLEMRGKQLYRNGQPVVENYVQHTDHATISERDSFKELTVPEDQYFVMGDNRDNSQDSRYWGFVPRSAIKAKAWRIYWSWSGFSEIRWDRFGREIK